MIEAVWPDDMKWKVSDVTSSQYQLLCSKSTSGGGSNVLREFWRGEHVVSHHACIVKERTDRTRLVSLFEQGRQILQINVAAMGDQHMRAQLCVGDVGAYELGGG